MSNIEEGTPLIGESNAVIDKSAPKASIVTRVANAKWKLLGASILFLATFAVTSNVSSQNSNSSILDKQDSSVSQLTKSTEYCADKRFPVVAGVDFVHYRSMDTGDMAEKGTEEHEAIFAGYKFWFKSAENKEKFLLDPSYYVPHWGGFCGWGISEEEWWRSDNLGPAADPSRWLYHQDKLILFMMEEPKMKFLRAIDEHYHDGDKRWNAWFGDDGEQVFNTQCTYNSFD